MGSGVEFSQEIFDEICDRLSDGESLRKICSDDDMPNKGSVFKWLASDEKLSDQYARAREVQADALFDDCLDIADGVSPEDVQKARLRIDTRKWMAGKLRPKKYGDKVQQELSGPDGGSIPVSLNVGFKSAD
ncbi:MAG: terminase small subunit protein [Epibacterium sp.]|nr:terminase small subunit protein [Epibacterium sp.]NQX75627.1 ubiquitin carboxyl-hydrolase [Epibacterium sp.]